MQSLIAFGAGRNGKALLDHIGKRNIAFFVDNDSEKQQKGSFYDVPLVSFQEMKQKMKQVNRPSAAQ